MVGCGESHMDEDGVTYGEGRDALAGVARASTLPGATSDHTVFPAFLVLIW